MPSNVHAALPAACQEGEVQDVADGGVGVEELLFIKDKRGVRFRASDDIAGAAAKGMVCLRLLGCVPQSHRDHILRLRQATSPTAVSQTFSFTMYPEHYAQDCTRDDCTAVGYPHRARA